LQRSNQDGHDFCLVGCYGNDDRSAGCIVDKTILFRIRCYIDQRYPCVITL
jgi:hypothetical protein